MQIKSTTVGTGPFHPALQVTDDFLNPPVVKTYVMRESVLESEDEAADLAGHVNDHFLKVFTDHLERKGWKVAT